MLDPTAMSNNDLDEYTVRRDAHPWQRHTINASDLRTKIFPPIRFVVPGLLPEGLTLLVSRPKLGKSWFVLDLCIAATSDRFTLGELKPAQGDVLYLALEDGQRRLQRRMRKLLPNMEAWPERLTFGPDWPRANEGGVAQIEAWINSVERPTLIVIDTLQKFRKPQSANKNGYGADYDDIGELQKLASKYNVAIVVVHHDRKAEADDPFDTISGTLGLSGAADTMVILKRNNQGVSLHVRGRDVEESETALEFLKESCRWRISGEIGRGAEVNKSSQRAKVIAALKASPEGMSIEDITISADLPSRNSADAILLRMVKDGEVVRLARGQYGLPDPDFEESA